jgi:predicted TIM-barrel fold metal-dependent hydrolase
LKAVDNATPALWDLEERIRIMDNYEGLRQVLTLASPPIEEVVRPEDTTELSKIANDGMAELVEKFPSKFVAAVACLPMRDPESALREAERAIKVLNFKGVQIYTSTNGKPIDRLELMPLYQQMSEYDLPIWIHPVRGRDFADYRSEDHSRYWIFSMFGWPYETTAAMTRLVFSGILEKYPKLKIITHHCGGMIPFFAARMQGGQDYAEERLQAKFKSSLSKPPIEYYRMFYADTALYGGTASLMCGLAFFGPDRLLFGTDMPYDSEGGNKYIRKTIEAIDDMEVPESIKSKIFEDNAKRLLRL